VLRYETLIREGDLKTGEHISLAVIYVAPPAEKIKIKTSYARTRTSSSAWKKKKTEKHKDF